jgi:hypothetical protein
MWRPAVRRRRDDDDDRRRRGRAPAEEDDAGVAGPSGWRESLREVPAKGMGRSARLGGTPVAGNCSEVTHQRQWFGLKSGELQGTGKIGMSSGGWARHERTDVGKKKG